MRSPLFCADSPQLFSCIRGLCDLPSGEEKKTKYDSEGMSSAHDNEILLQVSYILGEGGGDTGRAFD